jgi:hypothetical protein
MRQLLVAASMHIVLLDLFGGRLTVEWVGTPTAPSKSIQHVHASTSNDVERPSGDDERNDQATRSSKPPVRQMSTRQRARVTMPEVSMASLGKTHSRAPSQIDTVRRAK